MAEFLETSTGDGSVEVDTFEEGVDFGGGLGSGREVCLAHSQTQTVQGDVKRGYWWKDLNIIISTRCHTVQFKKIDGDNIAGGHSRHINT